MRRNCLRLLRIRNLLIVTILIILIYLVKNVSEIKSFNDVAKPMRDSLKNILYDEKKYFIPTSLKVSHNIMYIFNIIILRDNKI